MVVWVSGRTSIDEGGALSISLPGKFRGSRVSGDVVAVVAVVVEATSDASSRFVDSVAEICDGGAGGGPVGAGTLSLLVNSRRSKTYESSI